MKCDRLSMKLNYLFLGPYVPSNGVRSRILSYHNYYTQHITILYTTHHLAVYLQNDTCTVKVQYNMVHD